MKFSDITRTIETVFFPGGLALLAGIFLMVFSVSTGQSNLFTLGCSAIAFFGLIAIFFSLGLINRIVQVILYAVFLIGSVGVAYLDYDVIRDDLVFQRKKKAYRDKVVQSLKDIRTAEQAFKSRYEKYTGNWDTLVNFLKTDSIAYVREEGTRPDTLTEEKALELGIIRKDTFYTSVVDSLFLSQTARKKRIFEFKADSLPYVPGTTEEFILKTRVIDRSGGVRTPVFMAKDPSPFAPPDTLKVGSLTEASASGNWGD